MTYLRRLGILALLFLSGSALGASVALAQEAPEKKAPSLFGERDTSGGSYVNVGLDGAWLSGKFKGVKARDISGGVGVTLVAGTDIHKALFGQLAFGTEWHVDEKNSGDFFSIWIAPELRLQPRNLPVSPYLFGGAGIAAIAVDRPQYLAPVVFLLAKEQLDGEHDGEITPLISAGGGIEAKVFDTLGVALEFRYRYHNVLNSGYSLHRYGVGVVLVFGD